MIFSTDTQPPERNWGKNTETKARKKTATEIGDFHLFFWPARRKNKSTTTRN
jgi:hypothetical protein